jgi:phage terminase large subunit-like protein
MNRKQAFMSDVDLLLAELKRREKYITNTIFPDTGPLSRDKYFRALEFFGAGSKWSERLILGGNRSGKTRNAAYEVRCHATGLYPKWWKGRRFKEPVQVWAAGNTATTTRDILQVELYGTIPDAPKTGVLDAHLITETASKVAIPNALETIWVEHVSGGTSMIQFKSYDQRRKAYEGTSRHVIWLDEEPPADIYEECVIRTLTVDGIVITTFTPLEGLTPFLEQYLQNAVMYTNERDEKGHRVVVGAFANVFAGVDESSVVEEQAKNADPTQSKLLPLNKRPKHVTMIAWDEIPHLDEEAKNRLLATIPPYMRDARTRGIPNLGAGKIFPIPEEDIIVEPFSIPKHWPRGYGMDVGWNWNSAVWGAYDRETSTWYLYNELHRHHVSPPEFASGIRRVGGWIPGRIDPAAQGRNQRDGTQLLQLYLDEGLTLMMAQNAVEAGIGEVWTGLTTGSIKVFSTLTQWRSEYRMYRRDGKGRVVKVHDHLMDATRYLLTSGIDWLVSEVENAVQPAYELGDSYHSSGWMG